MLDFAKTVVGNAVGTADALPTKTRSQFILSTEDDGIANRTAMEVISAMTASGQQAVVCKLPVGIPHSMFSKQDFPYEKPWVPDLFDGILGFIIDEKPFPESTAQGGGCEISFESADQSEG
jgi:hypothetical protein